ncbi:hypothetical protein [Xanthomonas campestris]|uniref:hypothetical protein n=1 Tax=Xanthomonas campestris TaxID=339 RepID=UPI001290324D|nr:hypothetical protein [Xanthomonas campestris]
MFESLATKYLEAASIKVPFRYVLLFALGFIISFTLAGDINNGIIFWVLDFKLSSFSSWEYWKKNDPSLGSLVFSAFFVSAGVLIERLMANSIFLLMDKALSYRSKIREIYSSIKTGGMSSGDRQAEISIIESALLPVSKKIVFRASIAQFCGSLALALLLMPNHSSIDIFVGLGMLFISGLSVIRSTQIFISDYFPLATMRNILQRKSEPEVIDNLSR